MNPETIFEKLPAKLAKPAQRALFSAGIYSLVKLSKITKKDSPNFMVLEKMREAS